METIRDHEGTGTYEDEAPELVTVYDAETGEREDVREVQDGDGATSDVRSRPAKEVDES